MLLKSLLLLAVAFGSQAFAAAAAEETPAAKKAARAPIDIQIPTPLIKPDAKEPFKLVLPTPFFKAGNNSKIDIGTWVSSAAPTNGSIKSDSGSSPTQNPAPSSTSSAAAPPPSNEAHQEAVGLGAALMAGVVMGLAFL